MWILLVTVIAAVAAIPARGQDQVLLDSPAGQLNGAIVWGKFSLMDHSKEFANAPAAVNIGPVEAGLLIANEVVAFTADRAPAYKAVEGGWTGQPGSLTVGFSPLILLPVKVWVLCADPNCGPLPPAAGSEIVTKLAVANTLFVAQNAGIAFDLTGPNLITDLTGNQAKKAAYQDFSTTQQCGAFPDLVTGNLDRHAINLYVVRSVDNEFSRGDTCWLPNVVVLGHLFNGGLVAHEVGHNHWLEHAEFFPELSPLGLKNIMHGLSSQRAYFSEGEVYRMHFEKQSVLNRVSAIYSDPPVRRPEARSCPKPDQHGFLKENYLKPCPSLGTRLWVDP